MKKCRSAKNYKGIRKPCCNNGNGCDACWEIYQINCSHDMHFWKMEIGKLFHLLICGKCHKNLTARFSIDHFPIIEQLIALARQNEILRTEINDFRLDVERPQRDTQKFESRIE